MNFKEFYHEDRFYTELLIEATGESDTDEKEELKDLDDELDVSDRVGKVGFLKALKGLIKGEMSFKDVKTSLRLVGKVLDILDGAVRVFKGGSGSGGGKGTVGGGIFTSILRYNNPILKQITPEKESLDRIEEVLKKMDFDANIANLVTVNKFRILFRQFIKENPLPSEDTYEYIHDILKDIKNLTVTRKDIGDEFIEKLPPRGKETVAAKKKREADNKKGAAEQKKKESDWAKKFTEFLKDENYGSEVHAYIAPMLKEFGITPKINKEEIKADFANLYKKVLAREALRFGVSLTKSIRNFILVLISVYLMKVIKKVAFR
jgi:hypothetical protein